MSVETYSKAARDRFELERINRRELIFERRNGLEIILTWLRQTNEISLELTDEGANAAYQCMVPNNRVLDARDHPFSYLDRAGVLPEQGVSDGSEG